jgi:hypothetical protein
MSTYAKEHMSGWLTGSDVTTVTDSSAAASAAAAPEVAAAAAAASELIPVWMRSAAVPQQSPWDAEHTTFMAAMSSTLQFFGGKRAALRANALEWWKDNCAKLPLHGRAARQLLGIQATGVASESVFSDAGRIRGDLRSRLDKSRLRVLTLLNRWGRVNYSDAAVPSIPLLWAELPEADRLAILDGVRVADIDAEVADAVAATERDALEDAKRRNRVRKAEERNFRAVVLEEVEDEAKDGDEEEEEDGGITIEALDELSDAEN